MATTTATIDHIVVDEKGKAKIRDSRVKVIHLVMARRAENMTMDELIESYPHLSPAAIYAAFAYYYDHKEELERQIEEGRQLYEELCQRTKDTPAREKARALKKERASKQ